MQETLLGELSAARQVLLHGQIAEALRGALRRRRPRPPRRARRATTPSRRCSTATTRAPPRATCGSPPSSRQPRWVDEATTNLRGDPLGEDEAALWDALAQCCKYIGNFARGRVALDRALALYAERGDAHAQARVFTRFMEGLRPPIRAEQGLLETS